jgi:hypothetical protein
MEHSRIFFNPKFFRKSGLDFDFYFFVREEGCIKKFKLVVFTSIIILKDAGTYIIGIGLLGSI